MPDVTVAEQRERFGAWVRRRVSDPTIEWRETHVSLLAFTAHRVWKCKKAVCFPFVDLSTVALRHENCDREVVLNRRLAPDVYLGVAAIEDDQGVVVDHVVEMRRLPEDGRLAVAVSGDDRAGAQCIDAIADLMARFHERAARGRAIDRSATRSALTELWESNLTELRPFVGPVLDPLHDNAVAGDARRYLEGRDALFAGRIAAGRIRDGHGDLLADDVFCLPDGPRVLDCLEFDERLRFGDVLADLAFLAMDLERLGRRDLAWRLLDRYAQRAGDQWPASLEHFYVAYRAIVRAKVACLRVAEDPGSAATAREHLALAAGHLAEGRVRMVLIGGPPATGKTTLARALAAATGWPVIRSDEVRKELAGLPPTVSAAAPIDRGLYARSWGERTYRALLDRARSLLEGGRSVILDASWSAGDRRADAAGVADATASELSSFLCTVAPEISDARAAARAHAGNDASDATPAIAAALRARYEAWPEATEVDTSGAVDRTVARVLAQLGVAATRA